MDYEWSVLLVAVLCLVLSSLFFHHAKGGSNQNTSRVPKSPARIPVIGDYLWLRRTPLHQLSSALHHVSTKLGPVISLNLGLVRLVFVLDRGLTYEALVQRGALFVDHLPLRQRQDGAKSIVGVSDVFISTSNGAYWRLLRCTLIEVFHPQRLRSLCDARARVLDVLVGELRSQATASKDGVVQPRFCFHHAMSHIVAHMCFGESLEDDVVRKIESARDEASRILADVASFNFITTLPRIIFRKRWRQRFIKNHHRHFAIINPLILARQGERLKHTDENNRQNEPTNSYIDSLLNMEIPEQGNRRLSNQEMAALCTEFIAAGAHPTATVIEWVMANLVKYPDVQKRLYEEIIQVHGIENEGGIRDVDLQKMPYLKAVILETLRRHPPLHFLFPRFLSGDVELGGYHIPKGSVVLFEAGLDATLWEDPYDFKPERFIDTRRGKGVSVDLAEKKVTKTMPFGIGRRGCPGMSVAMLHLGYYVANLILEFEWMAVDEVNLSDKFEVLLVMKHQLRARLLPRV